MKTVNELKKLPASELAKVINQEVSNERKAREKELNLDYLLKHSAMSLVPERIKDFNNECAVHYTLGGLQALLRIVIIDLQETEATVDDLRLQMKDMLPKEY